MLIAHVPAGYIVSKIMHKGNNVSFIFCSLVFSLWPDFDLIYYYFFENTKAFHHTYLPHLPITILISFLVTLPFTYLKCFKNIKIYYWLFFVNWILHLLLDSFTGGILWAYPFSDKMFVLIKIPPIYQSWYISFILHWSFLIELSIITWAMILWTKTGSLFRAKLRILWLF